MAATGPWGVLYFVHFLSVFPCFFQWFLPFFFVFGCFFGEHLLTFKRSGQTTSGPRKSVVQKCTFLPALEPLLDAPPNILKCLWRKKWGRNDFGVGILQSCVLCIKLPHVACTLRFPFWPPQNPNLFLWLNPPKNKKHKKKHISSPETSQSLPPPQKNTSFSPSPNKPPPRHSSSSCTSRRYVVQQFAKVLPSDLEARKAFVQSGSLQKIQEARSRWGGGGLEGFSVVESGGVWGGAVFF